MPITVKHKFVSAIPDAGDPTIVQPSNWNDTHELTGLGTMAEQNANAVAITGGTISGVTLPASNITGTLGVPNGGTGASTLTGYVKGTGTTPMTASATIPNTDITGLGTASTKDAGAANGVATLDAGGKVPVSELPAAVLGALSYQGTWDANTNSPTLTSSVGSKGYYYVVSVAGNTDLNGITDWLVGDWAVFNGSIWQKVDNTETVTSVNGQTGAVVLTTTNVAEGTNLYYTDARARAAISAGTGISYDNATGVITNAAPDQTVVLNAGTGISTSGTYPNFTITNTSPSLGGDVVGPVSATDNAVARYDTTTGKLLQNSLVIIDDTGSVTGVNALTAESLTVNNNATLGSSNSDTLEVNARITTDLEPNTDAAKDIGTSGRNWRDGFFSRNLQAEGKVVSPHFDALNSAGGQLRNASGTPQLQWGGGGGNNLSVDVAININPANSQVDLSPTGTGTVRINPATAGTMNNMVIGGTTPLAITGTTITATSFVGSGASLTNVVNSLTASTGISVSGSTGAVTVTNTAPDQTVVLTAGTGISTSGTYPNFTITNTSPSSGGTVTSVGGTGTVSGISLSGTVTSSGSLTLGGALDLSSPPAIGGTTPNAGSFSSLTDSGNLTFTGTGNRITGDFSNATLANRVAFQTSTTNGSTTIMAIPNGTGVNSQLLLRGSATVADDSFGQIVLAGGSSFAINSTAVGSGAFLPMTFGTGGSEKLRIDTSGNLGVGVTTDLTAKLNFDASDRGETINIYASSSASSRSGIGKYASETRYYAGTSDFFAWRTGGPSGTERMRINSSGNFLVGTTSTTFSSTNYGLCFTPNAASFITVDTAAPNLNLSRNNNGDIFAFYRAGSQRGWISVETTGTTYGNLSDRRAKENFTDSPSALNTIDQVKVASFDWKEGGHTKYGFVAQDLNSVLPFAVTVGDESDVIEKPWGIDNTKIVPYLTKAIQELKAELDSVKAELQTLKGI